MEANLRCARCEHNFTHDIDESAEIPNCPECGFNLEHCNHPTGARTSTSIYSVDEGRYVERVHCSYCGRPI